MNQNTDTNTNDGQQRLPPVPLGIKPSVVLANPRRWIRKNYAQSGLTGLPLPACHPDAAQFCVVGALSRYHGTGELMAGYAASIERLQRIINADSPEFPMNVPYWNDNLKTTHAEVLRYLKEAGL